MEVKRNGALLCPGGPEPTSARQAAYAELYFRDGNRQNLTGVALHCRTLFLSSSGRLRAAFPL